MSELREELLKSLRRQSKGELIEMIGRGLDVQDRLWASQRALADIAATIRAWPDWTRTFEEVLETVLAIADRAIVEAGNGMETNV